MKRRIIIEVRNDSISDMHAVELVASVVAQGKISKIKGEEQYCFMTTFLNGYHVYARERYNTQAHSFVVDKRENHGE